MLEVIESSTYPQEETGRPEIKTCRTAGGIDYYLFQPGNANPGRVLVSIHGWSRNAWEQVSLFCREAARFGATLVVPSFPAARFPDYQRLGCKGERADSALNEVLDDASIQLGQSLDRFDLFGYSGGGQFAHRYALIHSRRVRRLSIGAAGWYTFPTPRRRFPYGVGHARDFVDLSFDLDGLLRIPTRVFVGEQDRVRDVSLRRGPRIDAQQGSNRVARAVRWVSAMRRAAQQRGMAAEHRLTFLRHADHSFQRCVHEGELDRQLFSWLFVQPAVVAVSQFGGVAKATGHPQRGVTQCR